MKELAGGDNFIALPRSGRSGTRNRLATGEQDETGQRDGQSGPTMDAINRSHAHIWGGAEIKVK